MQPIMHGLEAEYAGEVTIDCLNIDNPKTAEAKVNCLYRLQPYLVLLDGKGEVVGTWQGY